VSTTSTTAPKPLAGACALAGALVAAALLFAPSAFAGPAIGVCDGSFAAPDCHSTGSVPSTTGVYFTVTTGGGNRNFASIDVQCDNGFGTTLTVDVPAKGTGYSQTIFPPAGTCTAALVKPMQIGKSRVLAGPVTFTVT